MKHELIMKRSISITLWQQALKARYLPRFNWNFKFSELNFRENKILSIHKIEFPQQFLPLTSPVQVNLDQIKNNLMRMFLIVVVILC